MRRKTTILSFLFISLSVMAGPVTPKKAVARAQSFLSEHPQFKDKLTLSYQSDRADGAGSYYYIYNSSDAEGFVIVSGDDRTDAILGYCDNGHFDPTQMPANMRTWLNTYKKAIQQMDQAGQDGLTRYAPSTEKISPLVSSRWDQDYPYNMYCPNNCPTGCVATALAQVMYYHRWPQGETSTIPGYKSYSYSFERPELEPVTFAWDKMRNSYGAYAPADSREAVALLMEYVGTALEMDYTPGGSGAQTYAIPYLASQYFGYSESAWEADRSEYSIGEWDELLLSELRSQRPVLYTGYTSSWEGHAFICDGYDGAGLFHINWGWGGYCDGYYRISLLDPDGSGIGGSSTSDRFSMSQSAIIGLSPEEVSTARPEIRTLTAMERPSIEQRLVARADKTQNFPGVAVRQYIANGTGRAYFANSGYGLFKDGTMIDLLHSQTMQMWPTQVVETFPTLTFGAGLEDGDYEIHPISTHLDNGQWAMDRNGDRHYIRVHIAGNEMSLTPVPLADFQVDEVNISGDQMSVRLTNPHEEFNGTVSLYTDQETIAEEQVAIGAGETTDIYLYLPKEKSLDEGDIYFLSVDQFPNNFFYSNGTNAGAELENEIQILNLSEVDGQLVAYGGKLYYNVNLHNKGTGLYRYTVDIALHDITRDKTSNGKHFIATINPGDTKYYPAEISLAKNMYGREYQIEVTHMDGSTAITTKSTPFKLAKGAVLWYENGDIVATPSTANYTVPEGVLAAELSTAYTKDAIANSNPNTIYLLGNDVPDGLVGHNVVSKDGLTGKLEFQDGFPYMIPTSITADALYYHRTIGWDESSWTALMLPFAPQEIATAKGEIISWPQSSADADGDLFLLRPTRVSQDGITTDYVQQMEAFRPYIMTVTSDLRATELVFSLHSRNTLSPTKFQEYLFEDGNGASYQGTFTDVRPSSVFVLEGPEMVYRSEPVAVAPFRFHLSAHTAEGTSSLPLLLPRPISTGISKVTDGCLPSDTYIYNIQGQRVGSITDLPTLPHGIYIVNGKKTIH